MLSVDEPPAVTEVGLNDALAPDGRPLADNATVCAEPAVTAVDTVAEVDEPAATEADVGDTEMEKSFVPVVQVGSPDWAGTATALHAFFTELKTVQLPGKRFLAALSVATRMFT